MASSFSSRTPRALRKVEFGALPENWMERGSLQRCLSFLDVAVRDGLASYAIASRSSSRTCGAECWLYSACRKPRERHWHGCRSSSRTRCVGILVEFGAPEADRERQPGVAASLFTLTIAALMPGLP